MLEKNGPLAYLDQKLSRARMRKEIGIQKPSDDSENQQDHNGNGGNSSMVDF